MAKFSGYLNLGTMFGMDIRSYIIDDAYNYANRSAMVVDTMMKAGISLFSQAEVCRKCNNRLDAETAQKKACSIMNTLYAWKVHPAKVPADCARSWIDDAWCTLHTKYEELKEKEVC